MLYFIYSWACECVSLAHFGRDRGHITSDWSTDPPLGVSLSVSEDSRQSAPGPIMFSDGMARYLFGLSMTFGNLIRENGVFLVSLVFQLPCLLFPPPGLFSALILRGKHAQPQKFEMQIFVAGPMLMAGVNFRVIQGILWETCRKPWLTTEVSYGFLTLSWRVKTSQNHILTCSN